MELTQLPEIITETVKILRESIQHNDEFIIINLDQAKGLLLFFDKMFPPAKKWLDCTAWEAFRAAVDGFRVRNGKFVCDTYKKFVDQLEFSGFYNWEMETISD